MTSKRIVIDTNVIISAAMNENGVPFQVVRHVLKNMVLLSCQDCLAEIEDVSSRPNLQKYLNPELNKVFFQEIKNEAEKITITGDLKVIKDDPDDDKFLETAIIGKADCIISGDKHLLNLRPAGRKQFVENWEQALWKHEGFAVPIVKPSEFLELIKS